MVNEEAGYICNSHDMTSNINNRNTFTVGAISVLAISCLIVLFIGIIPNVSNLLNQEAAVSTGYHPITMDIQLTHYDSATNVKWSNHGVAASELISYDIDDVWNWMPFDGWGNTRNSSQRNYSVWGPPTYGLPGISCTTLYTYSGTTTPKGGKKTLDCSDGTHTQEDISYAQVLRGNSSIGRSSFNDKNLKKTLTIRENGRTSLIFTGDPGVNYVVGVYVGIGKETLINTDGDKSNQGYISCSDVSVLGIPTQSAGGGGCWLRLVVAANSTVDITPSAKADYFVYAITPDYNHPFIATTTPPSGLKVPSVSYISSDEVSTGSQLPIMINGGNFATTNSIVQLVNMMTGVSYSVTSLPSDGYSLAFSLPTSIIPGQYNVRVRVTNSDWSNSIPLTVTAAGAPVTTSAVITSFTSSNAYMIIGSNKTFTLSWTATNASSCWLSDTGSSKTLPIISTVTKGPISQNTTYTLTCSNSTVTPATTVSKSLTVSAVTEKSLRTDGGNN